MPDTDRFFHIVLVDHGVRDALRGRRYYSVAELTRLLGDLAFSLPNGVAMLRVEQVSEDTDDI